MSDLAAILLILATFGIGSIATTASVRRVHSRLDDIVSGVVNGVSVPLKYRWFMLYQDFVGNAFGIALVLLIFMFGFLAVADVAGEPRIVDVANFCAGGAGWGGGVILVFSFSWVVFLTSVLRQAEAD
jgi:hypothetical protein